MVCPGKVQAAFGLSADQANPSDGGVGAAPLAGQTFGPVGADNSSSPRYTVSDRRIRPEGNPMSIVRVGLAETKHFAEGYDAIFGGKKKPAAKKARAQTKRGAKKKKAKKK